jgi:hypothetical protein
MSIRFFIRQLNMFFCRWVIEPPLDIVVPAKRTPWPETTTELPSELLDDKQDQEDRRLSRANKSSRPRSTTKRKGDLQGKENWCKLYWPYNVYLLHLQTHSRKHIRLIWWLLCSFFWCFCSWGSGPYLCRMGNFFFCSCICCVVIYTALETEMVDELWEVVYASEEKVQTLACSSMKLFDNR